MVTVFWYAEGLLVVDFMKQGCTINFAQYFTTLASSPNKSYGSGSSLGLQCKTTHQSPHHSRDCEIGWETLPHPPYSPDLTLSDFHLFGPLEGTHHGIYSEDEEAMKTSRRQWLKWKDSAFYHTGIHALVRRWTKTVEIDGDYIGKC
ncbi:hypothetical protein Trydic_g22689 [Trypoxylus dichotomus]